MKVKKSEASYMACEDEKSSSPFGKQPGSSSKSYTQSYHMTNNSAPRCVPRRNENRDSALACLAQWIECWPVNQRVAGSIPSQGTCLGRRPGPR